MTNSKNGSVTNRDLYDSIDKVRLELKSDLKDLRTQFDTLEAGRLTRAESNIADLRNDLQKAINTLNVAIGSVRQQGGILSAKAAIIGTITIIILTSLSAAVFYKLIVKQ